VTQIFDFAGGEGDRVKVQREPCILQLVQNNSHMAGVLL
jgi:hypothetical protein